MNEKDFETVERMEKHGGSFIKALAQCCYKADHINLSKIKTAFKEDWERYENW